MEARLTVAIPTYGRDQVLADTIANVLENLTIPETQILVADQTPLHDEETTRRLEEWQESKVIEWIQLEHPSLTAARNECLRRAHAEVVLFLDDDVILHPDFFEAHLRHYADPQLAAVAGQVFHCADAAKPPGIEDPSVGTGAHFGDGATTQEYVDAFVGCNHSIRRTHAFAVGGYDERILGPAYTEDSDMAHRLDAAGYRILYDPDAWVIHLRSPSGGCRIPGSKTWPEWTKSANYFTYAFRHWDHSYERKQALKTAWRAGPRRKENVLRPWRWPAAWIGFARAIRYGYANRRFEARDHSS